MKCMALREISIRINKCYIPGQLKEGAAPEDGTLEVEVFVAKLAEAGLVAHKLLLHYQDVQHHPQIPLVPTIPHPAVPTEMHITLNFSILPHK
jgi:hypothetical protein